MKRFLSAFLHLGLISHSQLTGHILAGLLIGNHKAVNMLNNQCSFDKAYSVEQNHAFAKMIRRRNTYRKWELKTIRSTIMVFLLIALFPGLAAALDLIEQAKSGDFRAIKRVVDANPKLANTKQSDGTSLLYFAAANGHDVIVAYLLKMGADANGKCEYGGPLHVAAERKYVTIVKTLLQWKADPNLTNKWGETPLHQTCRNSDAQIAQILIQAGGNVSAVDVQGRTPLHRCKNELVASALLAAGAYINAVDSNGYNALHWAATPREIVDRPTIELLLKQGIDVMAKDKDGLTPMDLAKQSNQTDLVVILQRHAKTMQSINTQLVASTNAQPSILSGTNQILPVSRGRP